MCYLFYVSMNSWPSVSLAALRLVLKVSWDRLQLIHDPNEDKHKRKWRDCMEQPGAEL